MILAIWLLIGLLTAIGLLWWTIRTTGVLYVSDVALFLLVISMGPVSLLYLGAAFWAANANKPIWRKQPPSQ